MQEDVRTAQEYQRENQRLKQLLKLSDAHEDYAFVDGYIISWDASTWRSSFTIAKGENAGLAVGMCAVTENGQVGGASHRGGQQLGHGDHHPRPEPGNQRLGCLLGLHPAWCRAPTPPRTPSFCA